jgi:hypothetical protein
MKTFTVIFKTGGNLNYKWNRIFTRFANRELAQGKAKELNKMGYETLIHDTDMLNTVGMPENAPTF